MDTLSGELFYRVPDDSVSHAIDITEALASLNYLIGLDAENPRLVRMYANQAEERVRALGGMLCSWTSMRS